MNGDGTIHQEYNYNYATWFVNVLLICYVLYCVIATKVKIILNIRC